MLAAADRGAFNASVAQIASGRLKRAVSFTSLQTHLLAARPTIAIRDLKVANPAWAGPSNLVEARRLDLALRWSDLLRGRFAPSEIDADGVTLNLVRAARDRKSWSSQRGDAETLASVQRLRLTDARFSLDDRVRDLRVTGSLSHDDRPGVAFPLSAVAQGVLKGGEVQISARGGRLNGRAPRAAYPFAATVQDGATYLAVRGVLDQPFQFAGLDLAVAARGPNLANMKYLIGVGLPNSAPYRLTGRLSRQGRTTRATGLKATVGQSDFTGAIVSDGSKPRRLISIDLTSKVLHAADVAIFLAHRPPHVVTRSVAGGASSKGEGRLLSDKPIDLKRFRIKDARLEIAADRFIIGGMTPGRLNAHGRLDHGRFELKPLTIAFPSGRADGAVGLDLNGPVPVFRLDGTARGPLASLVPSMSKSLNGGTDLRIHAVGAGGSWRKVGMNAQGRVALSIRDGDIQASKAKFLSGAVIQGALAALADKSARTGLACAVADLGIGEGRIRSDRVVLVTDAGAAVVDGGVDLATETIDLTIHGRPARPKLFSVNAPVSVSGPMLHPETKVRLGGDKRADPKRRPPEVPKVKGDRAAFCDHLIKGRGNP